MKILVTGGAGFLGSHLAKALLDAGHSVTILDDLSGGFERNVPSGAHFVKGSLTNAQLVRFLCKNSKIDAIYHLAAYAAEGLSHFIRRFNYENNVLGSVNLINAAIESGSVKKFIFTSSMAVYGHGRAPFKEEDEKIPADPYGSAKLAIEHDLLAARDMFGLDFTIFRPHNIYGPMQHIGDRFRNVVGIFMNQTLRGQPLTIFGDGTQKRAFSYVGDIISPMVTCLDMPETNGESYNIGGRVPYTILALAEAVREISGVDTGIAHLPPRNEVKLAYSDHAKLDRTFGVKSQTSLRDGLAAMWEWAKSLGPQEATAAPSIEVDAGKLPPSWRDNVRLT